MSAVRPIGGPAIVSLSVLALVAGATFARQSAGTAKPRRADTGFQSFMARVQDYVRLHKQAEATLPSLKPKEAQPEAIAAHQQALAKKIREARANAKARDIFTPASQPAFRRAVRNVFAAPQGSHVRATLAEGAPLVRVRLNVNDVYPDGTPQTTVPPTLLHELPKLPDEVEYRIVGRDLLLLDVRANLVVDVLRDLLP
jgi:hypothetical protein